MTQRYEEELHSPQVIIYRDEEGDYSVSLDGGVTSFYLTPFGIPSGVIQQRALNVCPGENEVWRSGPTS